RLIVSSFQNSHGNYLDTLEKALRIFKIFENENDLLSTKLKVELFIKDTLKKDFPAESEVRHSLLSKEYELMTVDELQTAFSMVI
ncbi:unnamed protein product, partial [Timema podura]|nr:unnamed protein product [Timema podura]